MYRQHAEQRKAKQENLLKHIQDTCISVILSVVLEAKDSGEVDHFKKTSLFEMNNRNYKA